MAKKVHIVSIAALVAVAAAASVAVAQLNGEQLQPIAGDFRNAAVAEVHDAQGQVLLRGDFAPVDTDDQGEVERLAPLTAVASQVTAKGEAEVEYQIATAKADNRGKVEIEVAVKATQ